MPANSDLLPKYKSYVGRTFFLRKHANIPATEDRKSSYRKFLKRKEIFGDACLVLDETNSKVKVTTLKHGHYLWISKFYLHKEVESAEFFEHDELNKASCALLQLTDKIDNLDDNAIDIILRSANLLKMCADELKPNKKER